MACRLVTSVMVAVTVLTYSSLVHAESGAKALFYGETIQNASQVIKTDSGTAVLSGTEMKTEAFAAKTGAVASEKKKKTTVAKKAKSKHKVVATGLSYFIEVLGPNGKVERGTEKRSFNSGERIRFVFKSNKEGYLYLLAIGSSGKAAILFPDSRINNGNNVVAANREYRVPFGQKSFVMDPNPGEEKVLVFFSRAEIPDIDSYFTPKKQIDAQDTKQIYALAETHGAKDILYEEDSTSATVEPATYVVTKDANPKSVIFKEIVVRHK